MVCRAIQTTEKRSMTFWFQSSLISLGTDRGVQPTALVTSRITVSSTKDLLDFSAIGCKSIFCTNSRPCCGSDQHSGSLRQRQYPTAINSPHIDGELLTFSPTTHVCVIPPCYSITSNFYHPLISITQFSIPITLRKVEYEPVFTSVWM